MPYKINDPLEDHSYCQHILLSLKKLTNLCTSFHVRHFYLAPPPPFLPLDDQKCCNSYLRTMFPVPLSTQLNYHRVLVSTLRNHSIEFDLPLV